MNIVFLSFYSGHVSRGAEVFIRELADRLGKKNAVRVFQSGRGIPSGVRYKTVVVPFEIDLSKKDQKMFWKRRIFLDWWSRRIAKFTIRCLLRLEPCDVLVPVDGGWESLLARLWAWKNEAKVVITGHSGMGWDDRINLLSHPDVFVAMTEAQANWARKNGFGVRVVKIPNGVDTKKFYPGQKPISLGLPRPIILAVGAFEENKRLDLVVKAVAQLPRGSLLLLGDGPLKAELKTLGQKLLPGKLKIMRVSHKEMPRYFASVDLFTLPTVPWEPFGLVYLEAMASGLPVVAPDDPIRREIVGEGGLFAGPTDAQQYSHTLERALSLEWDQKPLKQAQKFSWDKVAQRYEELFRSIIK